MKRIPLTATAGEPRAFARVDDEDYDAIVAYGPWTYDSRPGYAYRTGGRRTLYMHRVVLGLLPGDGLFADHIDGDGLNNTRANLRICSPAQNGQNRPGNVAATSRFRGVYWHKGKKKKRWGAQVRLNGRQNFLGYFTDEVDAAIAAQAFRDEHMPFAQPDPALVAALELRRAA